MSDLDPLLALLRGPAAQTTYDEVVTQLDHALQTAALAVADDASDALVAAALLHDVGHLLDDETSQPEVDFRHEATGARHLRTWFGPEVTAPIALHVAAKRYLCATEAGYLEALSAASTHSLALQGGPMDDVEAEAFERLDGAADAVRLRRWDDEAKVIGAEVPDLDAYVDRLRAVAGI